MNFFQDGSTFHTDRNHLIPYYLKYPFLYPHLRDFMRFSDSIQFGIPKPIKFADSESSSFNSNESLSDEQSLQNDLSLSYQSKPLIPSSNTNHTSLNPLSNDNSPLTKNENSTLKQIIKFIKLIHLLNDHVTHLRTNLRVKKGKLIKT